MDTPPPARKLSRIIRWIVWTPVFFVVLVLVLDLLDLIIQLARHLFFGWVSYLFTVLPRITFNAEIATDAGIALILATAGLHRVLVWWSRAQSGEKDARWRFASTIKVALMILLLFATSIAATGIVHQVGWLFRAEQLTYDMSRGLEVRQISNMRQIATALHFYAQDNDGKQPRDLDELIPDFLDTRQLFYGICDRGEPPGRILYFPDNQVPASTDPAQTLILAGPRETANSRRVIVFRDTSARVVPEATFQEMLRQQTPPSARIAPPPP